jgi:hypothetical protein
MRRMSTGPVMVDWGRAAHLSQVVMLPLALLNEVGQLSGQELGRHVGRPGTQNSSATSMEPLHVAMQLQYSISRLSKMSFTRDAV